MTRLRSLLSRLALAGVAVTACADQPALLEPEAPQFGYALGDQAAVLQRTSPQVVTQSRTETIGPRGGRISVAGVTLEVPAGALSGDEEITMTVPAGSYVQVVFAPHGLQFDRPATLSFNLKGTVGGTSSLGGVYFEDDADAADGQVTVAESFDVTLHGNTASFPITHFSGYCISTGRGNK